MTQHEPSICSHPSMPLDDPPTPRPAPARPRGHPPADRWRLYGRPRRPLLRRGSGGGWSDTPEAATTRRRGTPLACCGWAAAGARVAAEVTATSRRRAWVLCLRVRGCDERSASTAPVPPHTHPPKHNDLFSRPRPGGGAEAACRAPLRRPAKLSPMRALDVTCAEPCDSEPLRAATVVGTCPSLHGL